MENKTSDEIDIEKEIIEKEEVQILNKAMDRLPYEKREILFLSKYQSLKYKEIADIMGCSEGNVKVRVYRALCELKEIYLEMETEKK